MYVVCLKNVSVKNNADGPIHYFIFVSIFKDSQKSKMVRNVMH